MKDKIPERSWNKVEPRIENVESYEPTFKDRVLTNSKNKPLQAQNQTTFSLLIFINFLKYKKQLQGYHILIFKYVSQTHIYYIEN